MCFPSKCWYGRWTHRLPCCPASPACKNEISSSIYGCLHLGDMLEQAISCHGAEESSLQAAESSWVCGLKGFFNYSKGPELKVGFPKILSLPFHREETGPSDRSCAVQERHSVRGSSSDKTQQCSKINERAPIIFLLWPLPFFLDRVLICSQWQIRRCEVLARNNNINSIQPAAWVSVGVGSMFKKKKKERACGIRSNLLLHLTCSFP